jgi:hypothetical protein
MRVRQNYELPRRNLATSQIRSEHNGLELRYRLGGSSAAAALHALGPADGNPIGLGLLAVVAGPVGGVGVVLGLIVMLVQKFVRREQ